jgi:Mg/Co/Ni transporter MgtE
MQPEEAEEVRELLGYPENSAGGIMTTEYVTIPPDITVAQAIERVRQEAGEVGDVYYLYVVDDEDRLLGVLSLKELVLAEPNALVRDVMHRDVLKVDLYSPQERVAQMVAKYNLLAIPVVDENNVMRGIVTVDDAIDILLPTAWKKRLPRIFH